MPLAEFAKLSDCVLSNSREIGTFYEDVNILPLVRWAAAGRAGSFVELGANDGKDGSMTWLLEKCFGWRGVLIEAHPHLCYNKLMAEHRPGSQKFCAAVCPAGETVHMSGFNASSVGGLAVALEFMSESYKNTWANHLDSRNTHAVPCRPMRDILAEARVPSVDFLSLDVQGAEAVVLNTTDLSSVSVVLVEQERTNMPKNKRVRTMLHRAGFVQLEHIQQPQKTPGGAGYNELYAKHWLTRRPANVSMPGAPSAGRNRDTWPLGELSILYPRWNDYKRGSAKRLQWHDRRSFLARFADGLAAMDEMTEVVRAEQLARR